MMHYLLTLPQSPRPNELHIWDQFELDSCCGDVKVLYENESAEKCFEFAKEESWSDFYYNGFFSGIFPSIDEMDMCYVQEAFYNGFDEGNTGASYNKYLADDRRFGKGLNNFGQEDFVLLVNCYVAGTNYRSEGIPCGA
jgi:hypothetical protein